MYRYLLYFLILLLPAGLFALNGQPSQKNNKPLEGKLMLGGGILYPKVTVLNQYLAQGGFEGQNPEFYHLGVDYQIFSENFISDLEFYWSFNQGQTSGTYQVSFTYDIQLFNIGYLIINYPFLHFYPLVGVGRGSMTLSASETGSPNFTDILTNASRSFEMDNAGVIFNAGVGLDIILPTSLADNAMRFCIGFRAGYLFDLSDDKWNAGGVEVSGGPAAILNGAYIRLMMGIAI